MHTILTADRDAMGRWVAEHAAADLRQAISTSGGANIVVATGASQFEVLGHLVQQPDIDWSAVHGFHLDEYVGLSSDHGASFCRYLKERFVDHVDLAEFHYLRGDQDPAATIGRVGKLIANRQIDLALVGIGENGHLAFNDPPADFETSDPYLVVNLDEACRQQQLGEGWFPTFDDVPQQAISMSVRQIMSSQAIVCTVPDDRKAEAVRGAVEGDVTADVPASILQRHERATLFLDSPAASQLAKQ